MSIHLYESFLYQHYKTYRDFGGDHIGYEICNELDRETADKLRKAYDREQRVNERMKEFA
jgi:hypothetical protein